MRSGVLGSGDLEKKNCPSFDGCVSAERREVMWCRTGVVASGLTAVCVLDLDGSDEISDSVA